MSAPFQKSVRVRCSIERAFELFTGGIDRWWPASHKKPGAIMRIEPHAGGRFYQQTDAGDVEMGSVLVWEPPHRLVYSWIPGTKVGRTEVEVRFTDHGSETQVDITHSEGNASDFPVERFERAWNEVLPAFERAI